MISSNFCIHFLIFMQIILISSSDSQFILHDDHGSHLNGNSSEPNCQIISTNFIRVQKYFQNQLKILQIFGEYGELIINCTASFQLDLDYDGTNPTEALKLNFWKNISLQNSSNNLNEISSVNSYGLMVTITSIEKLYRQHLDRMNDLQVNQLINLHVNQDTKLPLKYSRTGLFRIRGMFPDYFENLIEFYIFFEEPNINPGYLKNEKTLFAHYNQAKNEIVVPCRPSHYVNSTWIMLNVTNELTPMHFENVTFDPTKGFSIFVNSTNNLNVIGDLESKFEFRCTLHLENVSQSIWQGGLRLESTEGESEGEFVQKSVGNLKKQEIGPLVLEIQKLKDSKGQFYWHLRCLFYKIPDEHEDSFYSIGLAGRTILELRYMRAFVLPEHRHLSYLVQKGRGDDSLNLYVDREASHGAIFCQNKDAYIYQDFVFGLSNKSKFRTNAGKNWIHLPTQLLANNVHVTIERELAGEEETEKVYTFKNYTYHCRVAQFSNVAPLIWLIKHQNGTVNSVWTDERLTNDGKSTIKIKLERNIVEISCLTGSWMRSKWYRASLPLELRDGSLPIIANTEYNFEFSAGSKGQINCRAQGDPSPVTVWWERDNETIPGTTTKDLAVFEIPKMTPDLAGVYICKTRNEKGEGETREFKVVITQSSLTFYLIVSGVTIAVILTFVTVGLILYIRHGRMEILTSKEIKEFHHGVNPKKVQNKSDEVALVQPYQQEFEIPADKFTLDSTSVLGSGAYGLVLKGTVGLQLVAVKTLKGGARDKLKIRALMSELKILMYLGCHPHLINLIGGYTVHLKKGIIHLFVEYCDNGSLLSFLQTNRAHFQDYDNVTLADRNNLDVNLLHKWAYEISLGMSYLASKKVIHGDLATRNVLLMGRTAKITDFGLSRQMLSCSSNYTKQTNEALPWAWMSLEALTDLQFSTESDIWSYGVTLWELYSLGQTPFSGLRWDTHFINQLKNGLRLTCPQLSSIEIYDTILVSCWHNEPHQRPPFDSMSFYFQNILINLNSLAQNSAEGCHVTYVNDPRNLYENELTENSNVEYANLS